MTSENDTTSRTTSPLSDVQGVLASLATLLASFQAAASRAAPTWTDFATSAAVAIERVEHWDAHATAAVKAAVKDHGLIVPASQLTFPEVVELLTLYEKEGTEAVVVRLNSHYDEIFRQEGFLDTLLSRWQKSPFFQRRARLLAEALRAHELGMYGVSVPTLLAQFEGLVIDIEGHSGATKFSQVKSVVAGFGRNDGALGEMLSYFVNETLLAHFAHGSTAPPFSRHAILHGGALDYGTETNSRTAILLLDYLRVICDSDRP